MQPQGQFDTGVEVGRNDTALNCRPSSLPASATERHPDQLLVALLGHSSVQTTLICLELVPAPTGSLAMAP